MKAIALALLLAGSAFGQCGRMVYNPLTGKMDCVGGLTISTLSTDPLGTTCTDAGLGKYSGRTPTELWFCPTAGATWQYIFASDQLGTGILLLTQGTAPDVADIPAGKQAIYVSSVDGLVHVKDHDGVDVVIGFPATLDTDVTLAANSDTKVPSQKAVKSYAMPSSYLDTDGTMAANSNTKVPSQAAVRTYVAANAGSSGYDSTDLSSNVVDEEFLNTSVTNLTAGKYGWGVACTSGAIAKVASDEANYAFGLVALVTSGSTGGSCLINLGMSSTSNTTFGKLGAYAGWTAKFRFKLDSTTDVKSFAGFSRSTSIPSATVNGYHCGVRFDSASDTQFTLVCDDAVSTIFTQTVGAVDSNWHTLTIRSTVAGTILLKLDSGTEYSTTDMSTTQPFGPIFYTETLANAAKTATVDTFRFKVTGMTR